MRFLVDECTGPSVARWLRAEGHDATSIYDDSPGVDDEAVIRRAFAEARILVTNDKDFGEMVYRERHSHRGVVLLRPGGQPTRLKIRLLERLLRHHLDDLPDRFVVVTEQQIRFARP